MGKIGKFILTLTAFAPILLVYAIVCILNTQMILCFTFIIVFLVLALIYQLILNTIREDLDSLDLNVISVENADGDTLNLLLIYLIPLITRDIGDYNWIIWLVITLFFCIVVAVSYGHQCNPLLMITGYHYYKVKGTGNIVYILITKRRISTAQRSLQVSIVSDYLLIDLESSKHY